MSGRDRVGEVLFTSSPSLTTSPLSEKERSGSRGSVQSRRTASRSKPVSTTSQQVRDSHREHSTRPADDEPCRVDGRYPYEESAGMTSCTLAEDTARAVGSAVLYAVSRASRSFLVLPPALRGPDSDGTGEACREPVVLLPNPPERAGVARGFVVGHVRTLPLPVAPSFASLEGAEEMSEWVVLAEAPVSGATLTAVRRALRCVETEADDVHHAEQKQQRVPFTQEAGDDSGLLINSLMSSALHHQEDSGVSVDISPLRADDYEAADGGSTHALLHEARHCDNNISTAGVLQPWRDSLRTRAAAATEERAAAAATARAMCETVLVVVASSHVVADPVDAAFPEGDSGAQWLAQMACDSSAAAEIALLYACQRVASSAARQDCRALLCVCGSAPAEAVAHSTWALLGAPRRSGKNSPGEDVPGYSALIEYLGSLTSLVSKHSRPMVLCRPARLSSWAAGTDQHAAHGLTELELMVDALCGGGGSRASRRASAALRALRCVLPVESALPQVSVRVPRDGAVADASASVTLSCGLVDTSDLLTYAGTMAKECYKAVESARAAGETMSLSSATDYLQTVVARQADAPRGVPQGTGTLTTFVASLFALELSADTLWAVVKAAVGVSCLALVDAPQRMSSSIAQWGEAQASDLLGYTCASGHARDAAAELLDCLVHTIADFADSAVAPLSACAKSTEEWREVALALLPAELSRHERGGTGAMPDLLRMVLAEAVAECTLSTGLVNRVRREAIVEGLWEGQQLSHSFAVHAAAAGDTGPEHPEDGDFCDSSDFARDEVGVLERTAVTLSTVLCATPSDARSPAATALRQRQRLCGLCMTAVSPAQFDAVGDVMRVRTRGGLWVEFALSKLLPVSGCTGQGLSLWLQPRQFSEGDAERRRCTLLESWVRRSAAVDRVPLRQQCVRDVLAFSQSLRSSRSTHDVLLPAPNGESAGITVTEMQGACRQLGLTALTQLSSQAPVRCFAIQAFCVLLLAPFVRWYCCCRRHSRRRPILATAPQPSPEVPALVEFGAPSPARRALLLVFLQLLAAARYREACLLCAREVAALMSVEVGVSLVFASSAVVRTLRARGQEATTSAVCLLQRVGRGLFSRRHVCAPLWRDACRLRQHASLEAAMQPFLTTYEARDKAASELVESSMHARRRETAQQLQTLEEVGGAFARSWEASADMLNEELLTAYADVHRFEHSWAAAERGAKARVSCVRSLLTNAWQRQTAPGGTAGEDQHASLEMQRRMVRSLGDGLALAGGELGLEALWDETELRVERALRARAAQRSSAERKEATEQHLQRQQQRFARCARLRDVRQVCEERVFAVGGRSALPNDRVGGPPEDGVPLHRLQAERDYLPGRDGMMRSVVQPTDGAASFADPPAASSQPSRWRERR